LSERIGELLLKKNLITQEQLNKATDTQKQNGGRLETALIKLGFIKE
jgi:type IV pilus assembly protein PilB